MPKALLCPDFKKPCIERDCIAWVNVLGRDPQGADVNQWGCSKYQWDHRVLIQVIQKLDSLGGAVESMRNTLHSDLLIVPNLLRFLGDNSKCADKQIGPGSTGRALPEPGSPPGN